MRKVFTLFLSTFISIAAIAGEVPSVGEPAPGFKLQDQNGEWHELKDYHGTWLAVYFYPKDQTPGCTTEACNFRDNIFAFKAIGAEIVGVSLDDVESHKQFSDKYKLPFVLLADEEGVMAEDYGVLRDYMAIQIASRQTFLVNPEGVIVKHYEDVDPDTHTQDVLADLEIIMSKSQEG